MNKKVLIVSDSQHFIDYSKQLLKNSKYAVQLISVAKRSLDAERFFKEYMHKLIIIDVDIQDEFMGKSIQNIRSLAKNSYIFCVEKYIRLETMRIMFKMGIDDYISIDEYTMTFLECILDASENENQTRENYDLMMEEQLALIRDGQSYDVGFVELYTQDLYCDIGHSRHMIFFRIDNINWVYQYQIFNRHKLKDDLRKAMKTYFGKNVTVLFTKKHSGFAFVNSYSREDFENVKKFFSDQELRLSFIISEHLYKPDTFIQDYKKILETLDATFYCKDQYIFWSGDFIQEMQSLREQNTIFSSDIYYRFRRKNFLNSDYFIHKSLNFIEFHRINKIEAIEFYFHVFQKIVNELFQGKLNEIMELKGLIKQIHLVNRFDDLKRIVLIINETLKEYLICKDQKKESPYIKRIKDYVSDNIDKPITLKKLSDEFGISEIYISRLFKKEVGINLFRYINKTKMEYASNLLNIGTLNVTIVAKRVGFKDSLYFSRVFRSEFGVSPSKYRRIRK